MSEILQSPEELLEERHAEALAIASEAGHILLENGAEISRVEETMERIASHYGVDKKSFFVLSNGIFTTSSFNKYANVEFIPFKGTQLDKVVAVNQLSRDIVSAPLPLRIHPSPESAQEKRFTGRPDDRCPARISR